MRCLPNLAISAFALVVLAVGVKSAQIPLFGQTGQPSWRQENTADPAFKAKFDSAGNKTIEVTFAVANVYFDSSDHLVIAAPAPVVGPNPDLNYPEAQDRFEVRLTSAVVSQLKDRGVRDLLSYFRYQIVHVKGKAGRIMLLSFPAILVRFLNVEKPEDIEVIKN
jgi:hypothetical protein